MSITSFALLAARAFFEGSLTGHPAQVKYKSASNVFAADFEARPTFAVAPGSGSETSASNRSLSICL